MLNVERRIDVDTLLQQLFDVLVAFGMAAAGGVGMGELVDQDQVRAPLERAVEVEFAQDTIDIDHRLTRQNLEAVEQSLRLLAAVRLDHADDDVHALLQLGASRQQHLVGFADARRRTDKNLEPPRGTLLFASGFGQQGLWRGPLLGLAPLVCHQSIFEHIARLRNT